MRRLTRRESLGIGAGAQIPVAAIDPPELAIEPGARLRVLRPVHFVPADEILFQDQSRTFTNLTGVEVRVDSEGWDELRLRTRAAAQDSEGPDVVLAWADDPHRLAEHLIDLSDLGRWLGARYGGWYPLAERHGMKDGRWIALPIGASGGRLCYRRSRIEQAGFDAVPGDLDGFLALCRRLRAIGHPPGLALGNATGDANAWCNWVVWAHGGAMVNEDDQVVIDSPPLLKRM